MATGMVAPDGHRYSRMVGCDRLGSFLNLSMAAGLVDRKPFTCLYRCAKDHAPQGKVNLYSDPHCCFPRRTNEILLILVPTKTFKCHCAESVVVIVRKVWFADANASGSCPTRLNPTRLAERATKGTP